MKRTASSPINDAKRWAKTIRRVSSGRWQYVVRITDLDTGRTKVSRSKYVRVR
jgi:hypothetical protein